MSETKKAHGSVAKPVFEVAYDQKSHENVLKVSFRGKALMGLPILNKGTAFTEEERHEFGLLGLLPPHILTIDQQLDRLRREYLGETTDIGRNIFLHSLHDRNETLFFRFVQAHLTEMMPIIYTPVVGETVKQYSRIYRRSRGLYITYQQRHMIDEMLDNWTLPQVNAICVTDSEAILGIGDQGLGGMGIPVAKLIVYTLCAGVDPNGLMPVILDVGTNNQALLDDPLYLGWRHERLQGDEYDEFVDLFVQAVKRRYPDVLLHWEDFGKMNARRLLDKYRNEICSFNDDIQGTAAVTLAALITAVNRSQSRFSDQRVVVYGAGTAGVGIADEIVAAMQREGLTEMEALSRMWLLNSKGLITDHTANLEPFQVRYARPSNQTSGWKTLAENRVGLRDVVFNLHPTMLIGTSTQTGAFTEEIVRDMAKHTKHPIVFPLSNPTSKAEATPENLLNWTDGRVLVATGTPFADVTFQGKRTRIGNCNNAFIFPGLALGAMIARARIISDGMISSAGIELSKWSQAEADPNAALMPTLEDVQSISRDVAIAVAMTAMKEGLATSISMEELERRMDALSWKGDYYRYIPA
jgi:malate dehydrogenase (oxaloacetate-decarboxylating)